jgi:hypothetical protein
MPTVVDLCNMALGRVGAGRITALTDATNEANWCNLYYEQTRNEVLRARNWRSATETQALARETTAPLYGWSYQFSMPTYPRALRIIEVYPASDYERMGRKILSNELELTLKYVKEIEDPNELDDILTEAIVLRLASKLATAVANKPELAQSLWREFIGAMQFAKQADGADSSGDDVRQTQEDDPDVIVNRS